MLLQPFVAITLNDKTTGRETLVLKKIKAANKNFLLATTLYDEIEMKLLLAFTAC